MLQSCETLITKINEWQKAISKLERLADVFLKSSDKKLKVEIENKKQEIISLEKEYQILAYPELPNGEKLFWPEKEALEEMFEKMGEAKEIRIKDNHLIKIDLKNLSQFHFDFSLFCNLELFYAWGCQLKELPNLPMSVKEIWISGNRGIKIPNDLTHLNNLEGFSAMSCQLKELPNLPISIKDIDIRENLFPEKEKQRIKEEYLNASIRF